MTSTNGGRVGNLPVPPAAPSSRPDTKGAALDLANLIPALQAQMSTVEDGIAQLRRGPADDDLEQIQLDMETAHEELRTAEEEIEAQRRQLDDLVQAQRGRQWQHERLLGMLPTAVIVTDQYGTIHMVNAAAAALLGARVDRLLRKPLQAFVASTERTDLRLAVSRCVVERTTVRRTVTLIPRNGAKQPVELIATPTCDLTSSTEITWLLMRPPAAGQPSAPATDLRRALVAALSELTFVPVHAVEEHEVLVRVARTVQATMGPTSSVTVTIGDPARPRALASTSALAQRVDGAQVATEEGPSRTAWLTAELVRSDDLLHDARWPSLARHLDGVDVHTALAHPVQVGDDLIGALNVYNAPLAPAEDYEEAIEVLATATAAVLHELDTKAQLQALSENLQIALQSRAVIEQAKGILMSREGCTADEAFERLADLSMRSNKKLRLVAIDIVQGVVGEDADNSS